MKETNESILNEIININNFSSEEILTKRNERLKNLIKHAKENSPFLSKLYKNIDIDNFKIEDLPTTDKSMLQENFENWFCNDELNLENIKEYLSDINNLSSLYLNKYKITTTSGTSGNPLVIIKDEFNNFVHGSMISHRLFRGIDEKLISPKYVKMAAVIISGYPTSSYGSYARMKAASKEYEDKFLLISVLDPINKICDELNNFQPGLLCGYPSVVSTIAKEQIKGNLNISPKVYVSSAEKLTQNMIDTMKKAWGDDFHILNNYCTNEGGELAMSCPYNNLHLNSDWVIVEPVDENDMPVKEGEFSNSILVTNLANYSQPIIRYRLNDHVRIRKEKCSCGSILPILEIDGRGFENLEFNGKEISIRGLMGLSELLNVLNYQFAQTAKNKLVLRIEFCDNSDKEKIKNSLYRQTNDFLIKQNCADVEFEIREEQPKNSQIGGKLKHIVKEI